MASKHVTAEFLKSLNKIVMGKSQAVYNDAVLDSAINRPNWRLKFAPDCPAYVLAAELAYGIVDNHAFVDGNKRTAFLAANQYLQDLGAKPFTNKEPQYATMDQVIDAALTAVANKKMSVDELATVYAKALGYIE